MTTYISVYRVDFWSVFSSANIPIYLSPNPEIGKQKKRTTLTVVAAEAVRPLYGPKKFNVKSKNWTTLENNIHSKSKQNLSGKKNVIPGTMIKFNHMLNSCFVPRHFIRAHLWRNH